MGFDAAGVSDGACVAALQAPVLFKGIGASVAPDSELVSPTNP